MRIKLIAIFLLWWVNFYFMPLSAQEFSVADIPEMLTIEANSVIRDSRVIYSFNNKQASVNWYTATTIMNPKALHLAHLKIFYNTNDKLKINKATIYDARGRKIRSIKRSEMEVYSMAGNATLYSEQRVIFSQVAPASYPFTVEYDYEITYPVLYGIRYFSPYQDTYQSVQKSTFTVVNAHNIPINVSIINLPPNVEMQKTDEGTYWNFINLPLLTEEPFSPDFSEIIPEIRVAPELIVYKKYEGKADTWENYGRFLAQLSSEDKGLSSETVQRLRQMTTTFPTTREKVKVLYEYLQSRTHYINISFGVGGIQPNPVARVDALGYGDCKDLSSYMIAMLKAVDIDAIYAVVKAGKNEHFFIPDLPNHQFNHAIVCVPNPNDTIWLECTSQVMPFDYLGSFTDNRYALLVKNEASRLVKTPEYGKDDNYIHSNFTLLNHSDGAIAKGSITYGGLRMENVVSLPILTRTEQLSWLNSTLEIADFTIISHHFRTGEAEANIFLDLELGLKSYFSGTSNRLFVPLNLNNKVAVPARLRSRKYPLHLPYAFHTTDTLNIQIPAGYTPVDLPQALTEDERFGTYSMQTIQNENTISCIRSFEFKKGRHAPEAYQAFYEFMQKISLADARPLVLLKEE